MYNGVGVSTPRGTGTNGYVSTNLAHLPKRKASNVKEIDWKLNTTNPIPQPKPNQELLDHDKKRMIEVKVMEWMEMKGHLDEDLPPEEFLELMSKARIKIIREEEEKAERARRLNIMTRERIGQMSSHEQAKLREERQIKIAQAFGIKDAEYKEGDGFDPEVQEAKKQKREEAREEIELKRQKNFSRKKNKNFKKIKKRRRCQKK